MNWVKMTFRNLIPKPNGEMERIPDVLGVTTDAEGKEVHLCRGPRCLDSLSDDLVQRVALIREALADVFPMSMEGWLDSFMRDIDPEGEICIVEACAAVYSELVARAELTHDQKRRLYGAICAASWSEAREKKLGEIAPLVGLREPYELVVLVKEAMRQRGVT